MNIYNIVGCKDDILNVTIIDTLYKQTHTMDDTCKEDTELEIDFFLW